MECLATRTLLLFPAAELVGSDRAALQLHLESCQACRDSHDRESRFDSKLRVAMNDVPVPSGLRDSLQRNAAAKLGAAWRRKTATGFGAGLAVLLALGLAFSAASAWLRPAFHLESAAAELERERDNREGTVQDWLKAEGLPTTLHRDFDYGYYLEHGKRPLLGKDAAFVLFQNGPDTARVFILRPGQFQFPTKDKDLTETIGSQYRFETDRRDGCVYLFAYSGQSLEPFLKPRVPLQ